MVTYHVGERHVEHPAYMRAVLGPDGGNQYPGFSAEPLDAFRHLANDLTKFCGGFLSGSEEDFEAIANKVAAERSHPPQEVAIVDRTYNNALNLTVTPLACARVAPAG